MCYLLDNGIKKIYIVSRTPEKNKGINHERVELIGYEQLKEVKGDMIINATPVGMFPNEEGIPVEDDIINNFQTVVDIVYNPVMTKFLSKGKELGKEIVGGLSMLIGQGVKSQEIWQKNSIDDQTIKDIYEILNREFS